MAYSVGDVVQIIFPNTDGTPGKERPAMIIAVSGGEDFLAVMISSSAYGDATAIPIPKNLQYVAHLNLKSVVRPRRVLLAHNKIVSKKRSRFPTSFVQEVKQHIISWLSE